MHKERNEKNIPYFQRLMITVQHVALNTSACLYLADRL